MKSSATKKHDARDQPQAEKTITEICLSSDGKRLIFLFANGEGYAVGREALPFDDGSPITHFEIFDHGCAIAIQLASGTLYDLPWDSIKYYAKGGSRKPISIGASIDFLRKKKGLTQAKLAELCGLSRVQISRIESSVSEPSLDSLMKIATVLRVTLAQMTHVE